MLIFFQTEKQSCMIWSKYNQCNKLAYLVFEDAIIYSNSSPHSLHIAPECVWAHGIKPKAPTRYDPPEVHGREPHSARIPQRHRKEDARDARQTAPENSGEPERQDIGTWWETQRIATRSCTRPDLHHAPQTLQQIKRIPIPQLHKSDVQRSATPASQIRQTPPPPRPSMHPTPIQSSKPHPRTPQESEDDLAAFIQIPTVRYRVRIISMNQWIYLLYLVTSSLIL